MKALVCVIALLCGGLLSACSIGPRQPLNPPKLVTDSETDIVLPLFMQATLAMAKYYGYRTINYEQALSLPEGPNVSSLPFMPPVSVRATPHLVKINPAGALGVDLENTDITEFRKNIHDTLKYDGLVRYYITTGLQTAKIVCRNYMTRLDEHSQYLTFLRREFGFASSLATGVLLAVDANQALTNAFSLGKSFGDDSIGAYQDYRFLNLVDRDAALVLITAAQDEYAKYFLEKLKSKSASPMGTDGSGAVPAGGKDFFTFADALNAVNTIEHQCTREGIRNLVTRAVNNTPANMSVDSKTGAIIFSSASQAAANSPNGVLGQATAVARNAAAVAKNAASSAQNAATVARNAAASAANAAASAGDSVPNATKP